MPRPWSSRHHWIIAVIVAIAVGLAAGLVTATLLGAFTAQAEGPQEVDGATERDRSEELMLTGALVVGVGTSIAALAVANRLANREKLGPVRRRAGGVGEQDATPVPGGEEDGDQGQFEYH